jgi:hypothetical protein
MSDNYVTYKSKQMKTTLKSVWAKPAGLLTETRKWRWQGRAEMGGWGMQLEALTNDVRLVRRKGDKGRKERGKEGVCTWTSFSMILGV